MQLVAEDEIAEGTKLRLACPSLCLPCSVDAFHHHRQALGRSAARRPADAVLHDAPDHGLGASAEHDRDSVAAHRPWRHGLLGPRHRLAAPGPLHQLQGRIQAASSSMKICAGHSEVIGPATGTDAEHEPAARNLVQGGGLLGQQNRLASGGQQDVGEEPDLRRRGGGRGEGDELFIVWIANPADRRQRGEAERIGAMCDVDEQPSIGQALVSVG